MKIKNWAAYVLIIFAVFSLVFLVVKEVRSARIAEDKPVSAAPVETGSFGESQVNISDAVIVYYFHTTARCRTCIDIENQTKETISEFFSSEEKQNKVVWKPVKVDEPQNNHFVRDYELVTKSVLLSKVEDGKEVQWKNLDRIWELVRDRRGFSSYIKDEIDSLLGES